ncbi:MAG: GAF domain-containing protein [Vicinamibacterales bacterium]
MRSRPAKLTLSALAWIALGAAAFFTVTVQQQIDHRRTALRAFESTARDAADALDDVQAGQQAYVAVGQDASDWVAKVAAYLQTATTSIDTLRSTALSGTAGPVLLDASTSLTQLSTIDRAVREHMASEDNQAAADAVFSEATDAVSSAVSNVEAAIDAEQQSADAFETTQRRAQVYALGGVAGLVAIILAMLGFAPSAAARDVEPEGVVLESGSLSELAHEAVFDRTPVEPPMRASDAGRSTDESLNTLAALCTEFGRVRDAGQLKGLLEQAARVMNARGLIVWLGSTTGGDLRPVLAHGYADATLARIPTVARSADNAAATAYRTGDVQVVKSRPGAAQGAVVAPLLVADGCIGALTAEIRDRGEESATTRALAQILAAQLAGVLAAAADSATGVDTDAGTGGAQAASL